MLGLVLGPLIKHQETSREIDNRNSCNIYLRVAGLMPTVNVYSYLIIAAFDPHSHTRKPESDRLYARISGLVGLIENGKPKTKKAARQRKTFQNRRKRRTEAKTQ